MNSVLLSYELTSKKLPSFKSLKPPTVQISIYFSIERPLSYTITASVLRFGANIKMSTSSALKVRGRWI